MRMSIIESKIHVQLYCSLFIHDVGPQHSTTVAKMEMNYTLSQSFHDKVVINKYKSSNLPCQNIYEKNNNKTKNSPFTDG